MTGTKPPAPALPPVARDNRGRRGTSVDRRSTKIVVTILLIALGAIFVYGFPYYRLPLEQRVRSPLHPWLRPSGYVGQSLGLASLAVFLFLWLYPLRKKFRWLSFTGTIARWLDVHVVSALVLPLAVALHAAWRFGGVIGLGFWSMMVVWASGIVGRYLYARIPRSRAGVELTREEIIEENKALMQQIAQRTGLEVAQIEAALSIGEPPPGRMGLLRSLWQMVLDDFAQRRAARRFRRLCRGRRLSRETLSRVLEQAREEIALRQQTRMLDATHNLFRFWHVAHRPVAVAALVAVLVHVIVVVSLGATWLW